MECPKLAVHNTILHNPQFQIAIQIIYIYYSSFLCFAFYFSHWPVSVHGKSTLCINLIFRQSFMWMCVCFLFSSLYRYRRMCWFLLIWPIFSIWFNSCSFFYVSAQKCSQQQNCFEIYYNSALSLTGQRKKKKCTNSQYQRMSYG